jgi:hypothetical protein
MSLMSVEKLEAHISYAQAALEGLPVAAMTPETQEQATLREQARLTLLHAMCPTEDIAECMVCHEDDLDENSRPW